MRDPWWTPRNDFVGPPEQLTQASCERLLSQMAMADESVRVPMRATIDPKDWKGFYGSSS